MDYSSNPNALISIVNTRGRVMWAHAWELDLLRKQGGKIIHNPKQDYYPEWDQELNKIRTGGDIVENTDPDILPVEEL